MRRKHFKFCTLTAKTFRLGIKKTHVTNLVYESSSYVRREICNMKKIEFKCYSIGFDEILREKTFVFFIYKKALLTMHHGYSLRLYADTRIVNVTFGKKKIYIYYVKLKLKVF